MNIDVETYFLTVVLCIQLKDGREMWKPTTETPRAAAATTTTTADHLLQWQDLRFRCYRVSGKYINVS